MRLGAALAALLFLSACGAQRQLRPEDIRAIPYAPTAEQPYRPAIEGRVRGVRSAINGEAAPVVRILTVHGMVVSQLGSSSEMQEAIVAQLNSGDLTAMHRLVRGESTQITLQRGYSATINYGPVPVGEASDDSQSILTRTVWVDEDTNRERLVFYELFWAPLRDEVKYEQLGCFESRLRPAEAERDTSWRCPASPPGQIVARPNPDSRTMLSGYLKDNIMVGGFADAVIEIGPIGDILRDDTELAVCVMALDAVLAQPFTDLGGSRCEFEPMFPTPEAKANADSALRGSPYFAITESLGSHFFLEGQMRRAIENRFGGNDYLAFAMFDQAQVYMFANQVALLNFSSMSALCVPDPPAVTCPNRFLRTQDSWLAGLDQQSPFGSLTTYIAFNDVDDLLGFELPPYLAEVSLTGPLINVSVRNPGFQLRPFFKSPMAAHTHQARNPAIIHAIVEGFDVPRPAGAPTRTGR